MSQAEVIVTVEGRVGRLTLNRPQALHALTTNMCELMTAALVAWRSDPDIDLVLLDHSGDRGFCAGGDIRMLAESGAGDGVEARAFFHTEYRLNHLLFEYPKPVVVVMDGITMGGGVGLSMPARYRVATERTTFAMPETGIGLFPDVGGGWFLPRMPGHIGLSAKGIEYPAAADKAALLALLTAA
jgi:enoyl-CoA hydratase